MIDDFEITIAAEEPPATGTNVSLRYTGGVRLGTFSLASIAEAVWQLNVELPKPQPSQAVLEVAGRCLFDALFTGRILDAFRESLTLARTRRCRLRVRLYSQLPAIIAVPWEYLHDEKEGGWLALHPEISLVRTLPLPAGEPLPVDGLLRVLVLLSSPTNRPRLETTVEWQNLQDATLAAPVELVRAAPTYAALLAALRQSPQVFHFVGHGDFDDARQEGFLQFVNDRGEADRVPADKLATLLGGCKTLRLVILNACQGAVSGTSSAFAGIAQRLIQHQIPAVLAMQASVADEDAIRFSDELYHALADGLSLERAVGEGRKRISGISSEWGIPALYFQGTEPFIFPTLSDEAKAERLWQKVHLIDDVVRRRNALNAILALHREHAGAHRELEKLDAKAAAEPLYAAAEANYRNQQWREAYRALQQVEDLASNYRDTRWLLAEVVGKLGERPDVHPGYFAQHTQYRLILNALKEGYLVPFLGWEVSRFGRPVQDGWVKGLHLPGADELARVLAEPLGGEVEGKATLPQVSEYVALLEGESVLYNRLHALYAADYPPTMLHHLLAELPGRLRAKGYPVDPARRFVVFSTTFDDLLERAFIAVGQPYHLFAYRHQTIAANNVLQPGRFVHIPPSGEPTELLTPSTYTGHDRDRHPILIKLCGRRVTPEPEDSVTITEDQYLEYLSVKEIPAMLPLTLLKQINRRSFLFFGYSLQPWHFRLLWQRLRFQERHLHEKAWAIVPSLNTIEEAFWHSQDVEPLIASPEGVVAYVNKWLDTL